MQETRLTKEEVLNNYSNCETLESIIQSISQKAVAGGKVLCELRLNDKILEDDEIESLRGMKLSEIETLTFKVSTTKELLSGALESVAEFIEKMRAVMLTTSEVFRTGEMNKAQSMFESVLGGFDWTLNALTSIKSNVHEVACTDEQFLSSEEIWAKAEVSSSKVVAELLQAFQKKDFILIADLLEYDLTEALSVWTDYLYNVASFAQVKVGEIKR